MRHVTHVAIFGSLFFFSVPFAFAQTAIDPSGHWQGSVQLAGRDVAVEADFTRNGRGELSGTMNMPDEAIRGLPLRAVIIAGSSIRFEARRDQPFAGVLSSDGKAMSGEYTVESYSLPFSMSRTGEAEIFEPETSAPIAKQLEGTWNGTLVAGGRSLRLTLRLANRPDGKAIGSLVSLDEGGLEIPVTITQDSMTVTVSAGITGSTITGALTADGAELAGTFTQRGFSAPLTLRASRP
jgi:hypothetical protein